MRAAPPFSGRVLFLSSSSSTRRQHGPVDWLVGEQVRLWPNRSPLRLRALLCWPLLSILAFLQPAVPDLVGNPIAGCVLSNGTAPSEASIRNAPVCSRLRLVVSQV